MFLKKTVVWVSLIYAFSNWCAVSSLLVAQQFYIHKGDLLWQTPWFSEFPWFSHESFVAIPTELPISMTHGRTSQSTPPQRFPINKGSIRDCFLGPLLLHIATPFWQLGVGRLTYQLTVVYGFGETTSRSDIELVAQLLQRRRLGKKGTCHAVNFCLISLIT